MVLPSSLRLPFPKQEKVRSADCQEAASMIPGFIADTLSERELDRFLMHVRSCRHCHAELETNFMVEKTVTLLKEELPENASFDLTPLLDQELAERGADLRRIRRITKLRGFIAAVTGALILFFLLDLTGVFHITVFFST